MVSRPADIYQRAYFFAEFAKLKVFGELTCQMRVYLKNRLFWVVSWLITKKIDMSRPFIFRFEPKVVKKQFIRRGDEFPVVSWFYADRTLYCVDITEDKKIQITKTERIELN